MEQLRMLGRGMIRHCPNCGQNHLFHQWLRMSDRCPQCGLYFEREEGYWTGAVAINTVITELIFIAVTAFFVIWTWPDVPMAPILAGAIALNIVVPLVFYPISKTLWVAIDLMLHPLEEREQHEVVSLRMTKQRLDADNEPAP